MHILYLRLHAELTAIETQAAWDFLDQRPIDHIIKETFPKEK